MEDTIQRTLQSIAPQLQGALLVLDSAATEIFHWGVSTKQLLAVGVADIYEYFPRPASAVLQNKEQNESRRVAMFLTTYVTDHEAAIRSFLEQGPFEECFVFSSLPESAYARSGTKRPFDEFAAFLRTSMGSKGRTASVTHLPIVFCPFSPGVFLLPVAHDVFPPVDENESAALQRLSMNDFEDEMRENIILLLHSLSTFLSLLGLKEECFAMGRLSLLLGKELNAFTRETYPFAPSAHRQATLILIDRTLDLVAPFSHSENLLDRLYATLSPLTTQSSDLKLPLYPPTPLASPSLSGCLAHPESSNCASLIDSIACKRTKEAFNSLCKKLLDILTEENLQLNLSQKPPTLTAATVMNLVQQFSSNALATAKHRGVLQIASGVAESLRLAKEGTWEKLLSVEKILSLTAADKTSASPLTQLSELLEADFGTVPMRDILKLTAMIYALCSARSISTEDQSVLRATFIDILLCKPQSLSLSFLGDIEKDLNALAAEGELDEAAPNYDELVNKRIQLRSQLAGKLEHFFARLRSVNAERQHTRSYRDVMKDSGASGIAYVPLVQQVVSDVFDERVSDIPDLERTTRAMGSSLLSSFGFQASKKPRVRDSIVVIFVVGGITGVEMERLREVALKHGHAQVWIGATRIATAESTYESLLCD